MSEHLEICDLDLEQFLLDELPDEEKEDLKTRADRDPNITRKLEEMKNGNREFLIRFPAGRVLPEIEARIAKTPSTTDFSDKRSVMSLKKILFILSPPLAAAILLFVFLQHSQKRPIQQEYSPLYKDEISIKGPPSIDMKKTQLLVYRRKDQGVELLSNRQSANFGDLLQLAYVSAGESHGMIFSIDGRGSISLHFPAKESGSTALIIHERNALPEAIELDDAPDFERFFFLTSDSPINVALILKSAAEFSRDLQRAEEAEFSTPQGIHQYSILIKKGKTP